MGKVIKFVSGPERESAARMARSERKFQLWGDPDPEASARFAEHCIQKIAREYPEHAGLKNPWHDIGQSVPIPAHVRGRGTH